ncbi:MAG: outer membrane protein assembly factor BamB family protein [Planctomycetota bacterium]|jgi:outer membrane protein assembly factor BamB
MMRAIAKLLLSVLIFFSSSVCAGADWNQFRGPRRNGSATESGLLQKWPDGGPTMLWSIEGLGKGFASVSVVAGTVYTTGMIGETGYLFAVNDNGKLKWKKEYGPEWTGSHPGTRTTPTVDGDRLYLMSGQGRIACFNRNNSELVWKVDTLEKFRGRNIEWGIAESVLIDGDKVFCTPGGKDATMVALNKHTGQTIWTTKGLSNLSAYCSPILYETTTKRLLFTMVKKLIVCVDSENGRVLWTIPHETRNDIAAVTPLKYCQGRVYFTSHGTGGSMIRFPQDGGSYKVLWSSPALDCLHGGVVLYRGLYGSDSKDNWVYQNISTGEVKFKEKILDAKGSIAYADQMLYLYSEKGTLALIEPRHDGMKLISSFKITQGTGNHWAHPVVCNGRLYIRHGDSLMAFDVKKK